MTSFQVALEVIQQATSVLAEWAGASLPSGYRPAADSVIMELTNPLLTEARLGLCCGVSQN